MPISLGNHGHDDKYYTKAEVDAKESNYVRKSDLKTINGETLFGAENLETYEQDINVTGGTSSSTSSSNLAMTIAMT